MRCRAWVAAVAILAGLPGAPAEASCSVSASGVVFGVYDVFVAAPTDSTGTITFRCGATDKNVRISISAGSSGTFTVRTLQQAAELLGYNLFLDAAFTQVWGDGSGGTEVYFNRNPQPNDADIVVTVFGRMPAGQDVAAGSYTDTVVVTIDY